MSMIGCFFSDYSLNSVQGTFWVLGLSLLISPGSRNFVPAMPS
jgi:hypothetical protein